jgi:tetratricopeptide (TPR) repeat protein
LRAAPRYNAHALVRAYANAQLAQSPRPMLRERWLYWCAETAAAVGFCWDDLSRLDDLDREHETIQAATVWAAEQGRDATVIQLVEGARYYHNGRGLWGEEQIRNHERRARAARRLGDRDNEILALAHLTEVLSKQGRLDDAAATMARLVEIGDTLYHTHLSGRRVGTPEAIAPPSQLRDDALFEYGHAQALYARAQGDLAGAERLWRQLLDLAAILGGQKYVVNRRWLATALLQQGDAPAARALYVASLEDARIINDIRSVAGNTLKLAIIDLASGDLRAAAAALDQCRGIATRHRDRRRLAECHLLTAQLAARQGDPASARAELQAGLNLFERLGMRREALEARAMGEGLG